MGAFQFRVFTGAVITRESPGNPKPQASKTLRLDDPKSEPSNNTVILLHLIITRRRTIIVQYNQMKVLKLFFISGVLKYSRSSLGGNSSTDMCLNSLLSEP